MTHYSLTFPHGTVRGFRDKPSRPTLTAVVSPLSSTPQTVPLGMSKCTGRFGAAWSVPSRIPCRSRRRRNRARRISVRRGWSWDESRRRRERLGQGKRNEEVKFQRTSGILGEKMVLAIMANVLNVQIKTSSLSRCGLDSAETSHGKESKGEFQKFQTVWKQYVVFPNEEFRENHVHLSQSVVIWKSAPVLSLTNRRHALSFLRKHRIQYQCHPKSHGPWPCAA